MKKQEDKSHHHRRDYSRDSSRDARYERSRNHYRRTRHDSSRDSSYYDHRSRRPRQRTPSYERHHQPTVDRYQSHYPQQMPTNVPYQPVPPSYQNQSYTQNPSVPPVQQQQNPVQQPQQQQFIPQNPNYINAGQHYPPNYQYSGMMNNLPNNHVPPNFANHNFSTMCFAPDNYAFVVYMPQSSNDYQNNGQLMSNTYYSQSMQNYAPLQMPTNLQQFAPSMQSYVPYNG